jgi:threonylcarbamoyladenosine tRNA methylthiotransferase MtaB
MFVDRCKLIRDHLLLPALTTDVIVGFPGETEADFLATCRVAREVEFSKIHIFPFSARIGTPAASMPEQLSKGVKAERARRLAELEQELRGEYFQRLVGKSLRVLVESDAQKSPGLVLGTSCRYAPVALAGNQQLHGQLVDCIPHTFDGLQLRADQFA